MVSVVFSLTNIANFVRMAAISTGASLSSILLRSILYFSEFATVSQKYSFSLKKQKTSIFLYVASLNCQTLGAVSRWSQPQRKPLQT